MSRIAAFNDDQKQRIAAAAISGAAAAALFLVLNWLLLSLSIRDLPRLGVSFFDAPFAGFIAGVLSFMPFVFVFTLPALGLAFALLYFARLNAALLQDALMQGAVIGAALCGGGALALMLFSGALPEATGLMFLMALIGAGAGAAGAGVHWRLRVTGAPNAANTPP